MTTHYRLSVFIIAAFLPCWLYASRAIVVPSGTIEAIWLSPMSQMTKEQKKFIRPIVSVQSFQMLDHAVTVSEFRSFLNLNPKWQKKSISPLFADANYLSQFETSTEGAPVTNVSWFAARAYCQSISMRLPTVNEWEYAAAASETKKNANRDEAFLRRILDWYGEPRDKNPNLSGTVYKNIYGIYDLHGLIWEWVEDFNSTFVTGESREDSSFNKDMFCGAGSLSSADKENYAAFMRFALRSSLNGKSTIWNLGFRCVKEVSP